MTWNSVMGLISSFALFLPIFFVLVLRLGGYKSFPALLIYYISVFVYNLFTEGYIKAPADFIHYWGLSNNLLDAPLMLSFLTYYSTSPAFTRRIKITLLAFLLFELVVLVVKGLNVDAITIIIGPGLLLVFGLCLSLFIRHTKITIMHRKATGKAFIAAALLFAYGCYTIIYLMYYVFKTPHVDDTFLVYFMVATFSSLLMCAGIIIEKRRVQKLHELKTTRKELSAIYKDTKKAAPSGGAAMLDFDRDPWN